MKTPRNPWRRGACLLAVICVMALAGCDNGSPDQQASNDQTDNGAQSAKTECIAPAKPGGGYDLTCRLLASGLEKTGTLDQPMLVSYMPGGIGAVAYNHVNATRDDDPNLVVAASTGAAVNLAEGKFGQYGVDDVRWLGAFAVDYGAIVVAEDSRFQSLGDLIDVLQSKPTQVTFGAGGTIGSQDWMKVALVSKEAGIAPRDLRFVSYEGGGEAMSALLGHHIDVYTGDLSELSGQIKGGKVRVLAAFADHRLGGIYSDIPTAKEQGYDIEWPTWRGVYMGPNVSDEAYDRWTARLKKLADTSTFKKLRHQRGLFAQARFGSDFDQYVKKQVGQFKQLAEEFGLNVDDSGDQAAKDE